MWSPPLLRCVNCAVIPFLHARHKGLTCILTCVAGWQQRNRGCVGWGEQRPRSHRQASSCCGSAALHRRVILSHYDCWEWPRWVYGCPWRVTMPADILNVPFLSLQRKSSRPSACRVCKGSRSWAGELGTRGCQSCASTRAEAALQKWLSRWSLISTALKCLLTSIFQGSLPLNVSILSKTDSTAGH